MKKLSARELRERARDAAACANMLNTDDADDITDCLIDDVIEWLCKNPRVPQFSRSEWDLQLADLRNEFAFGLGGMIAELDTPFDVTERVLEAIGIAGSETK